MLTWKIVESWKASVLYIYIDNVIHIEQKKKQMTVMVVDKEVTINTRSKKPNMK